MRWVSYWLTLHPRVVNAAVGTARLYGSGLSAQGGPNLPNWWLRMSTRLQEIWDECGLESLALAPLSGLYALGWLSYQAVYALGLKRAARPHSPVVCVGNLLVGGAGKTPLTLAVASLLKELGRKVCISASAYGFERSHGATLAPDGPLRASEWGDEGAMIRWFAPDVPIILGRDRVEAARLCHERHPDAVMLMDDGYQHLRLATDVRIVIDPPGLKNRLAMPAGPYREPRRIGLRRASVVLPGRFQLVRSPLRLFTPEGLVDDRTQLQGLAVNLLSAVARPQRLVASVREAGAEIRGVRLLSDHDPLTAGTLLDGLDPDVALLVTAKDWVKLRERSDLGARKILVASYDLTVEPRAAFRSWLGERIDEVQPQEVH